MVQVHVMTNGGQGKKTVDLSLFSFLQLVRSSTLNDSMTTENTIVAFCELHAYKNHDYINQGSQFLSILDKQNFHIISEMEKMS